MGSLYLLFNFLVSNFKPLLGESLLIQVDYSLSLKLLLRLQINAFFFSVLGKMFLFPRIMFLAVHFPRFLDYKNLVEAI